MENKRICRKCGKKIPTWLRIDGKMCNLQNRKFCIDCSPYQKHNTSRYDPIERKSKKWSVFSNERKRKSIVSLYYRALSRRREIIMSKGGKCEVCGYDRNERVLLFHHRSRTSKKFGLSLNQLWSRPMEEIMEEVSKCDLLCSNCHIELEDKIDRESGSLINLVNEKYQTSF